MQISHTAQGTIQLKTKSSQVILDGVVRIGDQVISGPGEYDVATVQCEGKALPLTTAYLLRDEELLVTYLPQADAQVTTLDGVSDTAILIVNVKSDDSTAVVKSIIKAIEPSYVFLTGPGATSELITEIALPTGEAGSLKVTRAGLPLEGTSIIPAA